MLESLKNYWQQLEPRERVILGWGSLVGALILFYALIWQPWHKAIAHMEEALQGRRAALVWMRQQSEMVKRSGNDQPAVMIRGQDQSLLSIIEQTARNNRVGESIQQMAPGANDNEVRVVMEQTNFNQWVRWIDMLFKQYGVNIKQLSAERDGDEPNVAEIRVTFVRLN